MMLRLFLMVLWLICITPWAFAGRPLCTSDAYNVEKGDVEVECGTEYLNKTDKEINTYVAITVGILKNLDLGVEIPYTFIDFDEGGKTDGFSDIKVATKLSLIKDNPSLPDTAIDFSYQTDSANDDKYLGCGKPEYAVKSIFTKSINKLTMHANLGYSFKEDFEEEDNEDALIYAFALQYALTEKLNVVAEITGDTVLKRKFDDNCCCGLIGLNYALSEIITLDLGFSAGISEVSPEFGVTTGITLAF